MQEKTCAKLNLDRAVFAMAGSFVLISLALGIWWNPWAFAFTAFVGANMLQASITGFCPAAIIFSKLGIGPGQLFKG